MIKFSATKFCSCSEEAADFLFGKRNKNKVHILKNGIDINEYIYIDSNNRKSVLKELQIVGRCKNHWSCRPLLRIKESYVYLNCFEKACGRRS